MPSQKLRTQLKLLNDVSKRLMHCQSIDEGIQTAIEEVQKYLNVQVASVFLFSKDGMIKRRGIKGIDKEGKQIDNSWFPNEEYQPGESFSGKAIPAFSADSGYGEPQYSNQLAQDYSMINGEYYLEKLGSLRCGISVPLNGLYRTFGTLEVLNKLDQDGFSSEDVYWLSMIGTSLANFISFFKAQSSFDVYKQLIDKLVSLEIIGSQFNLETIYQFVAELLTSDVTPYQVCIVRIPHENQEEDLDIKIKSYTDMISWKGRKDGSIKAGSQIVGEVYNSKRPIYIEDIDDDEIEKFNNKDWIRANKLKSFACLPILLKNECFGTISVYTKYNHRFYNNQKDFLEQVVFLTASIIARVKVIRELRKIRKERNEIREKFINTSALVGFDSLKQNILHQYKSELIDFYHFLENLAKNSHLNSKDRKILEEKQNWITKRIEELQEELQSDHCTSFSINTVIKEVLASFSVDSTEIPIQIKLQLNENIPSIVINERNIKDVIFNLLANAEKAIHKSGRKQGEIIIQSYLDVSEPIEYIVVTVEDNGIGIKNEDGEKIFEKGFTTDLKDGGTGLGLYVIREILNNYGGKIHYNSKIGKGTKFYLKIPWERYKS